METIRQVLEDPVPRPSTIRPGIPPELEKFILQALEKDKTKRHPTATAFAKALEAITAPPAPAPAAPAPAAPVPAAAHAAPAVPARSATKIVFWAVVLLILSVLSGLGVLQLIRGGAPGPH